MRKDYPNHYHVLNEQDGQPTFQHPTRPVYKHQVAESPEVTPKNSSSHALKKIVHQHSFSLEVKHLEQFTSKDRQECIAPEFQDQDQIPFFNIKVMQQADIFLSQVGIMSISEAVVTQPKSEPEPQWR